MLLWLRFKTSSNFWDDTFLGTRSIDGILCKVLSSSSNLSRLCVSADVFSAKIWKTPLYKLALIWSKNFDLSVAVSLSSIVATLIMFNIFIFNNWLSPCSRLTLKWLGLKKIFLENVWSPEHFFTFNLLEIGCLTTV